ncbi:hypothetical protein [Streptomyces sp. CB01580]|uniref:hypothetical protein n=1 Tax=Streptomyces sp. CB01580 TaxID=1703933 RepID=UPI00093B2E73|nr:hypothetical protein [Streptomyces sp. CB01580]OKJ27987.1 hypothetical protein AMK22_29170 [Streptomyces sp. CB01580]
MAAIGITTTVFVAGPGRLASPVMDIALVRSRWRAVLAMFAVLPWGLGLPLAALTIGLDTVAGQPDVRGAAMAVAAGTASFATVPAQVQTVRALLSRPRLTLETDALVIHDAVFLREGARIAREQIAEVDRLDWKDAEVSFRIDYDTIELTPFREPLNVEVRLHGDHGFASVRRLHHGTWIWRFARRWDRSPQFTGAGRPLPKDPDPCQTPGGRPHRPHRMGHELSRS